MLAVFVELNWLYNRYYTAGDGWSEFNWDEPERAPHKWYIESNLLHSNGTVYVGM